MNSITDKTMSPKLFIEQVISFCFSYIMDKTIYVVYDIIFALMNYLI